MSLHSPSPIGPGRPREFDFDDAVRDATAVFQAHGYTATSMVHLIEGTGLSRGSLYKAFSDKHSLFLAALDRYAANGLSRLSNDLDKEPPREAIRTTLRHYARLSTAREGHRGCLVTAAAMELLPADDEVRERVSATFKRMQNLLATAIRRGQSSGEISTRCDARAHARFLLCTIEGMRVLGKTGPSEAEMEALIAIAMDTLD